MGRSLLVVIGGYVCMSLVVMLGIVLATVAFVPGGLGAAMSAPGPAGLPRNYLVANLIVSFASAWVGAWVVNRFAASSKRAHVLAFIGLLIVMAIVSALGQNPGSGQPAWYPWVIPFVGLAGAAVGGWLSKNDAGAGQR